MSCIRKRHTKHPAPGRAGIASRLAIGHYRPCLPDDTSRLQTRPDIKPAEIEHRFVREHMGPIVVRGLWYPFTDVGVGI